MISALKQLVELNPSYHDYVAWPDLALVWLENGQTEKAIEAAAELDRRCPRVKHKVLLGYVLQRSERESEAREILEQALMDDENSAAHIRRQNRPWIAEAKGLLEDIKRTTRGSGDWMKSLPVGS